MSYANLWGVGACRGHFVARLALDLRAAPTVRLRLEATNVTGGLNASLQPGALASERNGGLLELCKHPRTLVELADVAPTLEWVLGANGHGCAAAAPLLAVAPRHLTRRAPPTFADAMHNSVHPLWVEEWGEWLGVGHRHYASGTDARGQLHANAPFQYGHSYRHVLFTLHAHSLRMTRFSREFCMPALSVGRNASEHQLCEGVQYVTSAFRYLSPARRIGFSYGINDCESALLSMSLEHVHYLLEFYGGED